MSRVASRTPTPQEIVDLARSESSPLHGFFDWDDGAAARKLREREARALLKGVKAIGGKITVGTKK